MRKTHARGLIGSLLFVVVLVCTVHSQENLTVLVTGLRSPDGQIAVMAFDSQQGFDEERPIARFKFPKQGLKNDTLAIRMTLEPGTYGFVFLDDINNNETMDKNLLQIPQEGFGFSGYEFTKPKKPAFDDFKLEIVEELQEITVNLTYL